MNKLKSKRKLYAMESSVAGGLPFEAEMLCSLLEESPMARTSASSYRFSALLFAGTRLYGTGTEWKDCKFSTFLSKTKRYRSMDWCSWWVAITTGTAKCVSLEEWTLPGPWQIWYVRIQYYALGDIAADCTCCKRVVSETNVTLLLGHWMYNGEQRCCQERSLVCLEMCSVEESWMRLWRQSEWRGKRVCQNHPREEGFVDDEEDGEATIIFIYYRMTSTV